MDQMKQSLSDEPRHIDGSIVGVDVGWLLNKHLTRSGSYPQTLATQTRAKI